MFKFTTQSLTVNNQVSEILKPPSLMEGGFNNHYYYEIVEIMIFLSQASLRSTEASPIIEFYFDSALRNFFDFSSTDLLVTKEISGNLWHKDKILPNNIALKAVAKNLLINEKFDLQIIYNTKYDLTIDELAQRYL